MRERFGPEPARELAHSTVTVHYSSTPTRPLLEATRSTTRVPQVTGHFPAFQTILFMAKVLAGARFSHWQRILQSLLQI